MAFGLMNVPATFQNMMDRILGGVPFTKAYQDAVVVFSKNVLEHMKHLRIIFGLMLNHRLRQKISKNGFTKTQVSLLIMLLVVEAGACL